MVFSRNSFNILHTIICFRYPLSRYWPCRLDITFSLPFFQVGKTNPFTWLVSEADPEVAKWRNTKWSLMKLSQVKSKSSPSTGKTICMNHGWKSSGGRKGRDRLILVFHSKRWSKPEQELSSQSTASQCSPRTGTDIPHPLGRICSIATNQSKR